MVTFAPDLVEVDWYPSLRAALRGLEKNAFSGVGYRPGLLALAVIGLLATHVAPFVLAWAGPEAGPPAVVGRRRHRAGGVHGPRALGAPLGVARAGAPAAR